MKSKENIVFLGMMGSGKSTIGKLFSEKMKLDFCDIDRYIEDKLHMSISKIFKEKGEEFFRKFEEKTTLNILRKKNTVISLGGGAFLNKNIQTEILSNHLSFWLKLDAEILIKRISNNKKRPLVMNLSKNELSDLIKKRSNVYSKALYSVNCNNLTKIEVINKIINIYETYRTKS